MPSLHGLSLLLLSFHCSTHYDSACTLITSKLVEITPPTADDYVYISDKTYAYQEILSLETTVCITLHFDVHLTTP